MATKLVIQNTSFDANPLTLCIICNLKQSDIKPFVKVSDCLCVSENPIHAHCMLIWQHMSNEQYARSLVSIPISTRCRICVNRKMKEFRCNDIIYNIKNVTNNIHETPQNDFIITSQKDSDSLTTVERYKIITKSDSNSNNMLAIYEYGQISNYNKSEIVQNFKYEGRRYRSVKSYDKTRIEHTYLNTNLINCIEMYSLGKKNGETIIFNPLYNNTISAILNFKNDKMDGKQMIYDFNNTNNPQLYEEYSCENGIIIGSFKRYSKEANIIIDANYDATGKLLFPYKEYHNTEKNNIMVLINEIFEEPNKMRVEEFHTNGRIKANYVRMKPNNMINIKWHDIEYRVNGIMSNICPPYTEYSSTGNIVETRELDETGFIKIETFYANKKIKCEKFVSNDENESLCHIYRYYFDTGQLNISCTRNEIGQIHGHFHEYFKNGQMKASIFYTNGEYDGEYKKWNSNGELRRDQRYADGHLQPV